MCNAQQQVDGQQEDVSQETVNGVPAANAPLHDNADTVSQAKGEVSVETQDDKVSSIEESTHGTNADDGVVYDVAPADK